MIVHPEKSDAEQACGERTERHGRGRRGVLLRTNRNTETNLLSRGVMLDRERIRNLVTTRQGRGRFYGVFELLT